MLMLNNLKENHKQHNCVGKINHVPLAIGDFNFHYLKRNKGKTPVLTPQSKKHLNNIKPARRCI